MDTSVIDKNKINHNITSQIPINDPKGSMSRNNEPSYISKLPIELKKIADKNSLDSKNTKKSSLPYAKTTQYVSDEQLTTNLKNDGTLLSPNYWTRKNDRQSLVETTGDLLGLAGTAVGAVGGAIVGTLGILAKVPNAGPIILGSVGAAAGEIAGEQLGEEYLAPVIQAVKDMGLSTKEEARALQIKQLKEEYQGAFSDKWAGIDIEKTLNMYSSAPEREAIYEAFIEKPKYKADYSPEQLSTLDKTTDKAGNKGRLLPGSDPNKRPNIGIDIGGKFKPYFLGGLYGDMFLNHNFKRKLLKSKDLSPADIDKATEIATVLRRSGMAILPRVEIFWDLDSGDKNAIVYARPNQIRSLINNKSLGKHVRDEIKKLPKVIQDYTKPEAIKRLKSMKGALNSGFRISIPLKDNGIRNMNVGYFFEANLLKNTSFPRKAVNHFGGELYAAVVVRTVPTEALDKNPKKSSYFLSLVTYVSNEAEASKASDSRNKKSKNTSETKSEKRVLDTIVKAAKGTASVASAIGKGIAKLSPVGLYAAVGGGVNITNIDPSGKVINEENGKEVYTTNIDFSATPDFISTSEDKGLTDYYMLPQSLSDAIDFIHPANKVFK